MPQDGGLVGGEEWMEVGRAGAGMNRKRADKEYLCHPGVMYVCRDIHINTNLRTHTQHCWVY